MTFKYECIQVIYVYTFHFLRWTKNFHLFQTASAGKNEGLWFLGFLHLKMNYFLIFVVLHILLCVI